MPLLTLQSTPNGKSSEIDIVVVPAIGAKRAAFHDQLTQSLLLPQLFGSFRNRDAPRTRILLFDYRDDDDTDPELDEISHHATCLLKHFTNLGKRQNPRWQIHFVGHSTGGLVVKQALILAQTNAEYSHVLGHCSTVGFFGVPHRGSSIMSEAPFAATVRHHLGLADEMSPQLMSLIAPNSDAMTILLHRFKSVAQKLQRIWTFIEMDDSVLTALTSHSDGNTNINLKFLIVDARSATLRLANETILPMKCKHAELLIPTKITDLRFRSILGYVHDLGNLLKLLLKNDEDLDQLIKSETLSDLHLFYDSSQNSSKSSIKVWSVQPKLASLIERGPKSCFNEKLEQSTESERITRPTAISRHSATAVATITSMFSERRPSYAASEFDKTKRTVLEQDITMQGIEEQDVSEQDVSSQDNSKINNAGLSINIRSPSLPVNEMNDDSSLPPHSKDLNTATYPSVIYESNSFLKIPMQMGSSDSTTPVGILLTNHSPLTTNNGEPADQGSVDLGREPRLEGQHGHARGRFLDPRLYPVYQQSAAKGIVTFQLPDEARTKFCWVHLPCNVLGWVPDVMQQLTRDTHTPELYDDILHESNFESKQNIARHGQPHSRYMEPSFMSFSLPQVTRMSIFLPYLHWDTFNSLQNRTKIIDQRLRQQQPHPVHQEIRDGHSLEHKLIWQYFHDSSSTPVHHRRSLDQYGYPNLKSTKARDIDQVIYKRRTKVPTENRGIRMMRTIDEIHEKLLHRASKNESKEAEDQGKVLMIDQLWCSVIDEATILTLFSPQEGEEGDKDSAGRLADLRYSIYHDVNGDPRFATQCHNVYDFAALVVSHAVKVFIEDMSDKDLQVFRVFEEYISDLTEQHTRSFKNFRDRYHDLETHKSDRESIDLVAIEQDLTALLELQDVYDELTTVDKLFHEQQVVISNMQRQYKKGGRTMLRGSKLLEASKSRIEAYRDQVTQLKLHCKNTLDAFKALLDMKHRQANVSEARAAREATEIASGQSRAVMIFTIFTIVFLPLSFFTGLFGMNVTLWSGVSSNPRLHFVFSLMFPISFAFVVVALLFAFSRHVRSAIEGLFITARSWIKKRRGQDDGYLGPPTTPQPNHKRDDVNNLPQDNKRTNGMVAGPLISSFFKKRSINGRVKGAEDTELSKNNSMA